MNMTNNGTNFRATPCNAVNGSGEQVATCSARTFRRIIDAPLLSGGVLYDLMAWGFLATGSDGKCYRILTAERARELGF